jgi:UDPglucose--hexose-1-phosphate uridylyltransferase
VGDACPFCAGNEAATPPEVAACRPSGGPPDSPGWLVRVVPNKYPALPPEEGVHEVVVASPRHVDRLPFLDDAEAERLVATCHDRLRTVAGDPRGLWPFLFLNQGAAAGASLEHLHAQVVGLPFAPPRLAARERAFAAGAGCPICADMGAPGDPHRIAEGAGLVAWVPRAPFPATVRIAPAAHVPSWDEGLDPGALGRLLRRLLGRVEDAFATAAANLWLHARRPGGADFHWHVELLPRRGTLAGLELGGGVMTALRTPDEVAPALRAGPARA